MCSVRPVFSYEPSPVRALATATLTTARKPSPARARWATYLARGARSTGVAQRARECSPFQSTRSAIASATERAHVSAPVLHGSLCSTGHFVPRSTSRAVLRTPLATFTVPLRGISLRSIPRSPRSLASASDTRSEYWWRLLWPGRAFHCASTGKGRPAVKKDKSVSKKHPAASPPVLPRRADCRAPQVREGSTLRFSQVFARTSAAFPRS